MAVLRFSVIFITIIFFKTKWLIVEGNEILNPSPYALSPPYLKFLARQERKIYHAMKEYTQALEKRLQVLQRYTSDYEESSLKATSHLDPDPEDDEPIEDIIAFNPILSFRMLSRYANEFSDVGENIGLNPEAATAEKVFAAKGVNDFPTQADATDAMQAILRLQFMYNIKASDLAKGRLPPTSSRSPTPEVGLTLKQSYNLAKLARNNTHFTLALDWFDVTISNLENSPIKSTENFDKAKIKADKLATISEHNRGFSDYFDEGYEHIYSKRIRSIDAERPHPIIKKFIYEYSGLRLNNSHPDNYFAAFINHIALCSGANFQTPKEKAKLSCWYDTKRNPYWAISPLKVELLNSNPPIIQLYDIVSSKWIFDLKTLAQPELERAPSVPNATPRTAAYAWFKDQDIPEIPLSRRVEMITGLNVVGPKASEALQIAAYAFGGHVDLHYDSKGPNDPKPDPKGDRVTTFLAYLNDMEFGGGLTTFPKLGFAVKPLKGSAVLWYTNLQNGGVDPDTLHGACPLIQGHKWIATKWTHINENIFKRPCSTNPLR